MTAASSALWLMAAALVEQLIGYVAFLAISRSLGAEGVGQYTFVFALAGVTQWCSFAGIEPYLVREAARRPEGTAALAVNALAVKLVLAGVAAAPAVAYLHLAGIAPGVRDAATLAVLANIVVALGSVPVQLLNAREMVGAMVLPRIAERVVAAALVVGLLARGGGLWHVTAALCAAGVLRELAWFALLWRVVPLTAPLDRGFARRIFVEALPFSVTFALVVVYQKFDSLLLWRSAGDAATGYYGAAMRVLDALSCLVAALEVIAYPRLCRTAAEGPEALARTARWTGRIVLLIAAPVACGLWLVAPEVVLLLYGPGFAGAETVLRALCAAQLFVGANVLLAMLLNATDRQRSLSGVAALAAAVNVGANLAVVPRWGALGAAAVAALTQLVILVAAARALGPLARTALDPEALARAALATAAMAAAVRGAGLGLAGSVAVGVVVYAVVLAGTGTFGWIRRAPVADPPVRPS